MKKGKSMYIKVENGKRFPYLIFHSINSNYKSETLDIGENSLACGRKWKKCEHIKKNKKSQFSNIYIQMINSSTSGIWDLEFEIWNNLVI